MKYSLMLIAVTLSSVAIAGELANGIETKVGTNGDVFVTLQPERSIQIRLPGKEARLVTVANIDGIMHIINVERGGLTPVSVELFPTGGVRIVTQACTSSNTVMTIDSDGDGIAERRVTRCSDGSPSIVEESGQTTWMLKERMQNTPPNKEPKATR